MAEISFDDFMKVDIRVGTVTRAEPFPEALIGTQVMGVVNFPPRQIGPFMSEVLVLGVPDDDGAIVLMRPTQPTPNGGRLH